MRRVTVLPPGRGTGPRRPTGEASQQERTPNEELFSRPRAGSQPLPFYFVWGRAETPTDQFESRFALAPEDLRDRKKAKAIADGKLVGFQVGNELKEVSWSPDAPKHLARDFGVLLACRLRGNPDPILLLIGGLSRVGTWAVAKALDDQSVDAAVASPLPVDQTVFRLVEVGVTFDDDPLGDNRQAGKISVLDPAAVSGQT